MATMQKLSDSRGAGSPMVLVFQCFQYMVFLDPVQISHERAENVSKGGKVLCGFGSSLNESD
jgi:hypothetical protein